MQVSPHETSIATIAMPRVLSLRAFRPVSIRVRSRLDDAWNGVTQRGWRTGLLAAAIVLVPGAWLLWILWLALRRSRADAL
jgi:hypothetical protein